MSKVAPEVSVLVRSFGTTILNIQSARLEQGKIFTAMLSHGLSQAKACELLNDAYPQAKDQIGYALNVTNLKFLANAWETFHASGGMKHGNHFINAEDVSRLALSPSELDKLAEKVKSGEVKIKKLAKQADRVKRDPKVLSEAQGIVRAWLAESQEEVGPETVAEPVDAVAVAREKVARLRAELAAAEAELAELEAAAELPVVTVEESTAAAVN